MLTIKNNYEAMIAELGIKPSKVIISGGGSNSPLMMQIFADALGIPTLRNQVNGAVAMGSAICVAVACGIYHSFEEATANMVSYRDEFVPNSANHIAYQQLNTTVYKRLPQLLSPVLQAVNNL